jgi:hypothetical protein
MNVKESLKKVRVRLMATYLFIFLVFVLIFEFGSPIKYVKLFFNQYQIISVLYGLAIFPLSIFHYQNLKKQEIKGIEKQTFHFLGHFPNFVLGVFTNISLFYVCLLVFNHVFNGTFSKGLASTENILIAIVMSYLIYQCVFYAIKMGRDCFIRN